MKTSEKEQQDNSMIKTPQSTNEAKSLSVKQVAALMNTSRQNVFDYIYRGRINPPRKSTGNKEYQITPAMLAELAQSQATDLIAMLGAYVFADALHTNNMINDERYNQIKTQFKDMLSVAKDIPALKNVVKDLTSKLPALKDEN